MKSFKEFIGISDLVYEVFDSEPAKVIPKKINLKGHSIYQFQVDDKKYNVNLYCDEPGQIYLTFSLFDKNTNKEYFDFTGTGNEFKVLNTVIFCVKEHLKIVKDFRVLGFTAEKSFIKDKKSGSRSRVYYKIIKRYFPDDDYEISIHDIKDGTGFLISDKRSHKKQKSNILNKIKK